MQEQALSKKDSTSSSGLAKPLKKEPSIYDTAFAVLNNLLSTTQTPYAPNDRISVLKLNSQQGGIRIINVCAPTLAVSVDDR